MVNGQWSEEVQVNWTDSPFRAEIPLSLRMNFLPSGLVSSPTLPWLVSLYCVPSGPVSVSTSDE